MDKEKLILHKWSKGSAAAIKRMETGEAIGGKELLKLRREVEDRLILISDFLFLKDVREAQEKTGEVVRLLEKNHFRDSKTLFNTKK